MKILVTGSRHWRCKWVIDRELSKLEPGTIIIQGGARGADQIAAENMLPYVSVVTYRADWYMYSRYAGIKRNNEMLDSGPNLVLAFSNDIATSAGTRHCVHEAIKRGIPVRLFNERGEELECGI